MSFDCSQKQKRPHEEGVEPRRLTLAGLEKETLPEGSVGPEMLSPAGFRDWIVRAPRRAVKPSRRAKGALCSA